MKDKIALYALYALLGLAWALDYLFLLLLSFSAGVVTTAGIHVYWTPITDGGQGAVIAVLTVMWGVILGNNLEAR